MTGTCVTVRTAAFEVAFGEAPLIATARNRLPFIAIDVAPIDSVAVVTPV